jgi:HlyD family secretion protein
MWASRTPGASSPARRLSQQFAAIRSSKPRSSLSASSPFVVPQRSLSGASTERVDTRVLQVIYRFKADGFPIHVGQQVDLFIEAPPISEITRKKLDLSVPNPLARSSYNWTE